MTDEITVAMISTGTTQVNDISKSGIPNIVANVFGTNTAVAATVNQTISLVSWFEDSVFIAVIPVEITYNTFSAI